VPSRTLIHRTSVVATTVVSALLVAGCGGGSSDSAGGAASSSSPLPSVSADDALAAQVPESIAKDGVLTVGSDTTYAPAEFIAEDGKTVIGFDVDLFTLVAAKLGLKAKFTTSPFDSIIAGVGSQKYEVGVSSFTISAERLAEANMVSYFNAGTQWATKKGNPEGVDPDNACGLAVAVQQATVQVDDITARSQACTDAGKPAITIDQYEAQSDATAAVVSGKDVAGLADLPVMVYAVQQTNGQLELLGDSYGSAPYGYVVSKDQTEFAQALADAVRALIDDGSYAKVLENWGVQDGAITDPTVNPTVG
jgi:polar amino acid transport system substrate-binding protein